MKIKCRKCEEGTGKRVVIKRNPLEKVDSIVSDGYQEFLCCNIIKFKRKGREINEWTTERCRNRILVKLEDNEEERLKE